MLFMMRQRESEYPSPQATKKRDQATITWRCSDTIRTTTTGRSPHLTRFFGPLRYPATSQSAGPSGSALLVSRERCFGTLVTVGGYAITLPMSKRAKGQWVVYE